MSGDLSGGGFGGTGFDINMHQLPVIGNFFSNPVEEAKLQAMQQAGADTAAYRDQNNVARTNALNQQMGQFAPVNNALTAMYGSSAYTTPLNASSPFPGAPSTVGNPSAYPAPPTDTGINASLGLGKGFPALQRVGSYFGEGGSALIDGGGWAWDKATGWI